MLKKGDYERILDFVSRIPADRADFRYSVLSLLKEMFGYQHLTFFISDEKGRLRNPIVINMSDTLMRDYEAYYFKTDIFQPINLMPHLMSHNVLSIQSVMSYRQFENTEFYADLLRKYGLYYELAVPLRMDSRLLGGIGILRSKDDGEFTQRDVSILNILNKHISSNLKMHLDTLQLRYEKQVIRDSVHGLPVGIIVFDDKYSILFVNETAEQYCSDLADDLAVSGSASDVVKALLARLPLQPLRTSSFLEMEVGPYNIKILPFIVPSLMNDIATYYAIYLTKTVPQPGPSLSAVSSFYHLTHRETEILNLMLEGLNNSEIAERLYVSQHTVKTHILNIFRKTKVNRRTALIKKIHEFPAG